ncbi:MAG: hypothetical protein SFY81_11880 [Verrucomicrobiota bacterium]|nr:hypothetical protein [Verrucomicrobiota bacterium]
MRQESSGTRVYDLVMTHKLDSDSFFIHRVQQRCAEKGMEFFLIEPLWAESFFEYFLRDRIWARALLNMHSEHHLPEDLYHRLVLLADSRKTFVIDPPAIAHAAFNKALLHPRLAQRGLNVPATIIVQRDDASAFRISEQQQALLGSPFVIKPAMGYGRRGVIMDAQTEVDLARSAATWPDTAYLLQKKIAPVMLSDDPAYFRVFYVFGTTWCCWWNCFTDQYRIVLPEEEERLQLGPLRQIVTQVADLTGMRFFSSEIAKVDSGEFVLIDYVNDQCHMLSQSADPKIGVPDAVVSGIADRLVEVTHEVITKRKSD